MKQIYIRRPSDNGVRVLTTAACIAVNVGMAFATYKAGIPMYLDSFGTIAISMLGGIFPGLFTAVATNLLCNFFNPNSPFYTFISVAMAMCTVMVTSRNKGKKKRDIIPLILLLALISGVLGTAFQWIILGGPQFRDVSDSARLMSESGAGYFFAAMLVNTGLNLIDKAVTTGLAVVACAIIPERIRKILADTGWKQKPLSSAEIKEASGKHAGGDGSLRKRMTVMFAVAAIVLTVALSWISVKMYFTNTKEEYTENAVAAAKFAANVIDPTKIDDYINHGKDAPGYTETRRMLYDIRDTAKGVKYLYVIKIREDGCYYVFDLATDDTPPHAPGDFAEFEEAFKPYLPALFAGDRIQPIESDDISGWVLTVYEPVKNESGKTVCYVGADVSMSYLSGYMSSFLLKTILIFSGFFALVLGYGVWICRYYLVYPIGSMTKSTKEFAINTEDQKAIDASVRKIRELDISTDDEVEELYRAICKMSSNMAEHIRSIRYYSNATAKMQNGLIMTMADMVENRDSDTGAHVQKTAAYVRILLETLKKKGYYTEKIKSNYISDVEMSAPLHDVGKINIPDAVLNKPGKLTDEEFAIMKTHTTAGKNIIEKAINTLQGENYLKEARNMAAYHHERWDGKGYPEGLHGEVIPLSARVMAIADVFDALVSPRVYKPAFPLEKAVSIIQEGAGTQFDPKCVEAFTDALPQFVEVMKKYQEN
ncbi:MAG: HD domain-containing protein [Lachnospiraceae bacterium]|nr:HD domain-containing protein [Lachnospiraceae bacterium]